MKVVVNYAFGGFGYHVPKEYKDLVYRYENDRTNPELVDFVENHPNDCGDLAVMTIPDNATDWDIQEDDGDEIIIYVVNGKIRYCCEIDDDDDNDD